MPSQRNYQPGLDMTSVDAHLVRPRTGLRGQRGIDPMFGASQPVRPTQPKLGAWEAALLFADETGLPRRSVHVSRDDRDRSVALIPFSSAFLSRAALEHAREHHVEAFFTKDARGSDVVAYVLDDASYGLLYRARAFSAPMLSVPGDPVITSSAHTGYRGGKVPFSSAAMDAPAGPPKPDYAVYGAASGGRFSLDGIEMWTKPEPGLTGVVEAVGQITLSALAMALIYRALGGKPL